MQNDREDPGGFKGSPFDPSLAGDPAEENGVEDDEWGQVLPSKPAPGIGESASALGSGGWWTRVLGITGLAVALAAAGYWWFGRSEPPPEPEPPAETAAPEPEPVAVEPPALPPLDASDGFLRALLAALTDHPDALAWLLSDDLARRIVVAVENVAEGDSPRRALAGLAPDGSFEASGEGEARQLHPESFARYDPLARAISAVDIPGLARAIQETMPLLELAYTELGRPDRSFAQALLAALDRLVAVPVPEPPILLVAETLRFEYRDPALEALDPASKHLLRFGPDNQRRIQEPLGRLAGLLRASSPHPPTRPPESP